MDVPKGGLTSMAFARLCGTTKETLRHYKDTGLLVPRRQGENGYFYYDAEQFYDFYAISIFRQTGTPLEEIRRCLQNQDAGETLALLQEQQERLNRQRRKLEQMEFVLSSTIGSLEMGRVPDMIPRTSFFETERLLAIPTEELEGMVNPWEGDDGRLITVLERCRTLCQEYGLQADLRLGAVHPRIEEGAISHLYTRIKEKSDCPYYMEKPAGTYLYLCCRGNWDISRGYAALAAYIGEQQLETAGSLYACDLAGFILNGVEQNAATMLSIRLQGGQM